MLISVLLAFLVAPVASATKPACVLPVVDGALKLATQPQLDGVITETRESAIEVESKEKIRGAASLDATTRLFTVYGGYVSAKELLPGQKVRVWFANCKAPKKGARGRAAVIMLSSAKPGKAWP